MRKLFYGILAFVFLMFSQITAYGAGTPGTIKWAITAGNMIYSSPAIGADGTVYVGTLDNKLYAITQNGALRWSYTTGMMIFYSSPAIGADGTIYVGSYNGKLYAINSDGSLKWSYTTGNPIDSSPAIGADGTIYVGGDKLYAINSDGTLKWSYTGGGSEFYYSPAIGADGTIYVGGDKLYAINSDGTLKWSYATGGATFSSPAIGADGTIYVGSYDHKLYAVNSNGTLKWVYTTGNVIDSSPAIGAEETIYVGSNDQKLYAINSDGTLKWFYTTGGPVGSSPAIGADGTIYVGSNDQKLYAINSDGTVNWSFTTADAIFSSPTIGSNGTIYVASLGSFKNNLYAIYSSSLGLLNSPWPMFHHDLEHTGSLAAPSTPTLTLTKSGSGTGTITSSPSGIDCGDICNAHYNTGTTITLTAAPDAGSYFTGWSTPCSGNSACTLTLTADAQITATFNPEGYPFLDVPSTNWAISYINAIYDFHITSGYGGTNEFKPNYEVTRDQMAAFLIRAKGEEPSANYCDSGCYFTDVATSGWACKYIQRLYELGITTGYGGSNQFRPELTVTRDQMAAFIIRAKGEEPVDSYCDTGSPFSDVPPSSWSCKYIKRLYELNIATGYGGTDQFKPDLTVTRAQMAAFIARGFLAME
jgi:outer membrane protein assembly factor BamB